MPSKVEEDTDQYIYTNIRFKLDTDTGADPIDRRESSSSRSTSALISTPIGSFDNLSEMVPASRPVAKVDHDNLPTVVSKRSIRRIGGQERTKSWAQQVQGMDHEHGSEGDKSDEDGLLKPPSHEPISRTTSHTCKSPSPSPRLSLTSSTGGPCRAHTRFSTRIKPRSRLLDLQNGTSRSSYLWRPRC